MGGKGSGRRAAPARVRLINGVSEGRDSGGRRVPLPPNFIRQAPEMPSGLSEHEQELWEATVPGLESLDLLTGAHLGILRGYTLMWDQALRARASVDRFGVLVPVKTRNGTAVKANPALRECRMAVAELRACARELGCTPTAESAIARLSDTDSEDNPFAWAAGR